MVKFDFKTVLQHEIIIINRAMALRPLEDEEYELLEDYECYKMGMFSFSILKYKYFNRYFNVR